MTWLAPDGITAIATSLLVGITGVATWVGGRAASSAAATYRLESEPVIVVHEFTADPGAVSIALVTQMRTAPRYVIDATGPVVDGIQLHERPAREPGGPASTVPTICLELTNVGRSPAVDVALEWNLSIPTLLKRSTRLQDFEAAIAFGNGTMRIPAIAAGSSVFAFIENRLGNVVTLDAASRGSQADWRSTSRGRVPIEVVASDAFKFHRRRRWMRGRAESFRRP